MCVCVYVCVCVCVCVIVSVCHSSRRSVSITHNIHICTYTRGVFVCVCVHGLCSGKEKIKAVCSSILAESCR
jgi:hypothetical protein